MGYLSKSSHGSSEEKDLFYDLWTLLQGEESGGITLNTMKTIILTIEGFLKGENIDQENFENSVIIYK